MLALLQPEEVSDRWLPLSVYVPFVQGFNRVYIFFQAVVESKAFLVPWTRSNRETELAQSAQTLCGSGGGGGYFVFQVKWKQIKVDFRSQERKDEGGKDHLVPHIWNACVGDYWRCF